MRDKENGKHLTSCLKGCISRAWNESWGLEFGAEEGYSSLSFVYRFLECNLIFPFLSYLNTI